MAEEMNINPELKTEAPTLPQEPQHSSPAIEMESLLKELETAGVTNPSQLRGQLTNAREYGKVVNMLGEIRSENTKLHEALSSIKATKQAPAYYEEDEPPVVSHGNIKDLVSGAVRQAIMEERKNALEAQKMAMQTWHEIQGDSDYSLIKEIWEDKMKDPNFNYQINTGEVDPRKAYSDVKVDYYKSLAVKASKAIKALNGGGVINPPHMESGVSASLSLPAKPSQTKEKIKAYKDRVNLGGELSSEEELEALISVLKGP